MDTFIYSLRVYIEDTDYAGVVYHANYLKYFERARSEWSEQNGFGLAWQRQHNIIILICSVKIDYLQPARLHDRVEVISKIAKIKPASVIYDQYLRLKQRPDTILCKAETKIACVDQHRKPCAIPKEFLRESEREH